MSIKMLAATIFFAGTVSCSVSNSDQNKFVEPSKSVGSKPGSSNQTSSTTRSDKTDNPDDTNTNVVPPTSPVETSPTPIVAMSFSEAKAKCVNCHSTTNTGPAPLKWNTANGTEADWVAKGQAIRESVVSGRMPVKPLSETDKARFLRFMDNLIYNNVPNQVAFEAARAYCTECHSASAQPGKIHRPYLDLPREWRENKDAADFEVSNNRMPFGKNITQEQRDAILTFVRSL
ncbi:MAG: cytochrome c [Betaproteobacteria bacterium]|nr:cytochrome c [Betaproteobacteria bacterium]